MNAKNLFRASLFVLMLVVVYSCTDKSNKKQPVNSYSIDYLNSFTDYQSAYYNLISKYSSGFVAEDQPIILGFVKDIKLKKQFGEDIPSSVFTLTPKAKGEAYWIDENTVAFKLSKPAENTQKYKVNIDLSYFLDVPADIAHFETEVLFKKQDFVISSYSYYCKDKEIGAYEFILKFANPTTIEVVEAVVNSKLNGDYSSYISKVSETEYVVTISGFERKNEDYSANCTFDGKTANIDRTITQKVVVPAKNEFKVTGYNLNYASGSVLDVRFSNPLLPNQNLSGLIEFDKKISYKTDVVDNKLLIYIDDKYNGAISINEIIKDNSYQLMDDDYVIESIETDKLLPSIKWRDDGVIVPDDSVTIYYEATALKSAVLRVIEIYDNNVLNFFRENGLTSTWGVRDAGRLVKKVKLLLDNDNYAETKTYAIKLSDYVDVTNGGVYQISLDYDMSCYAFACENQNDDEDTEKIDEADYWNGLRYDYKQYYYDGKWWEYEKNPCMKGFYNYKEIKKNVIVSDIGLTAKMIDNKHVDVFVRSIKTGNPMLDVTIEAYNYQLQLTASSKTDAGGYGQLTCSDYPRFVVAKNSNGNSFISLDNSNSLSMTKFDVGGASVSDNINGFIYSNRGVWRPGDVINLEFILSDKDDILPENYPVVFELYDANGRMYKKILNNAPVGNIYSFSVTTAAADPTGLWSAEITVGNKVFSKNLRVETMKPNKLQIDFDSPKMIFASQNPTAKLNVQWLNGLKVGALETEITAKLSAAETSFDSYKNYTFVNETSEYASSEFSLFSSKLNADGSKTVALNSLKDYRTGGFANVKFLIKVFETSGDFSVSSAVSQLSPFTEYVGVNLPETRSKYGEYYFTNQNWKFDIVAVNEIGKAAPNAALEYSLYKLENYWWWEETNNYSLQKYVNGTYKSPVEKKILTCDANGKSSVTLNVNDDMWGSYLMIIKDYESGYVFAKVVNFDTEYYSLRSSGVGETPVLLNMKSDKPSYKVGETVVVSFPANKNAKAFVTLESACKVLTYYNVDNLSEDATLKIKVTEDMIPNVYVYVSLIQPFNSGNDLPLRMYGVLPVNVYDDNMLLNPIIEMPAETESNKDIEITVSEKSSKKMYYTVALVDEGILGLTAYKTANPYNYFNSKQALNIRTWDNYSYVVDAYTGELSSVIGVGGDEALLQPENVLSKRFSAVAMQLGPFELAAGQKVTHKITVPDYVGSLRAMVIATNADEASGSAERNMIVKNKLMLLPAAPRMLTQNDRFFVPVQILAPDYAGKNVSVTAKVENLEAAGNTSLSKSVKVNADGEAVATFEFVVPEVTGTAKISLSASCESLKVDKSIELPIRTPYSVKSQVTTQKIAAGENYNFDIAKFGIDGTNEGKVSIYSMIPLNIFDRLEFLTSYPHGCLEQTVSKAFPLLYLNRLLEIDDVTKQTMNNNVTTVISDINAYMRSDYSMSNWRGGNYVNPWTEIYAAHFLVEAKENGYNVPSNLLEKIMSYHASKANAWRYNVDAPTSDVIQAYRLYVLALYGKPSTAAMNRFKSENLQPLSKTLLSAAYSLSGKTKVAKTLLEDADYQSTKWQSDYYISYGSYLRDLAFGVYAEMLAGSDESFIQPYINIIAEKLSAKDWLDTQTTAVAIFVLGKYADKNNLVASALNAVVSVDGNTNAINTSRPSAVVNFVPKNQTNIKVENKSNNPFYASVYTKGAVAEYDTEESGYYYKMTVKYYSKDNNKEINPASLQQNAEFYAKIVVENPNEYQVTEGALSFIVPAGWEINNERLFDDGASYGGCNYVDIRDDRANFYFDLKPYDKIELTVYLTAVYAGSYTMPPVRCDDMYNNEIYYVIPARKVVVKM